MGYLWTLNKQNAAGLKAIGEKKKSFASHILQHNDVMKSFTMSTTGGIELLELPVCEHCERVAANYHEPPGSAYCWSCGNVTVSPITLRQYLMEHLKIDAVEMELIEQEIKSAQNQLILEAKQ